MSMVITANDLEKFKTIFPYADQSICLSHPSVYPSKQSNNHKILLKKAVKCALRMTKTYLKSTTYLQSQNYEVNAL